MTVCVKKKWVYMTNCPPFALFNSEEGNRCLFYKQFSSFPALMRLPSPPFTLLSLLHLSFSPTLISTLFADVYWHHKTSVTFLKQLEHDNSLKGITHLLLPLFRRLFSQ